MRDILSSALDGVLPTELHAHALHIKNRTRNILAVQFSDSPLNDFLLRLSQDCVTEHTAAVPEKYREEMRSILNAKEQEQQPHD